MKAVWNGVIIAESDDTVVVEGNHYFPRETLRDDVVRPSDTHTLCPWKGTASYYAPRQEVARRFGATDVIEERGEDGARAVAELLGGIGADCVLECVGSDASMKQALATVRDGGGIGYVGVPHGVELPVRRLFGRNVSVGGGVAPARAYLPELLADVLTGRIDPSPVFDVEMPLGDVAEGYRAMHERRAIKVLLRP